MVRRRGIATDEPTTRILILLFVAAIALGAGSGCGKETKPGQPATTDALGQKPDVQSDEELLQGIWTLSSFETDGRKKQDVAKGRAIIKGAEWTLGAEGESGDTFAFKLFPRETPRGIDLLTRAEPKAPTLGIYKLEGDSLTLCLRGRGGRTKEGTPIDQRELTRPTHFSSEGGNMLLVLARKKS